MVMLLFKFFQLILDNFDDIGFAHSVQLSERGFICVIFFSYVQVFSCHMMQKLFNISYNQQNLKILQSKIEKNN